MHVFFKFSGLFLFALAIVFAGNGVFELQNAGILLTTNLAWLGRGLPWAGLYPNLQVISVQGLLLAGAILAWVVIPRAVAGNRRGTGRRHQPRRQARLSHRGRIAVLERWAGPIVVVLILGGVIADPGAQSELKGRSTAGADRPRIANERHPRQTQAAGHRLRQPAGFREYPIGDEVERNQMRIAAVWLPPVQMEGMADPASSDLIHLEADIHATEGNRNGFPKDEFVPYLMVHYTIVPAGCRRRKSDRADPRDADADGRPRRLALRGHHRDAQGRPLQADLRDRAPLGGRTGTPRRPGHRRRPLVEAVRGLVRLGLSGPPK